MTFLTDRQHLAAARALEALAHDLIGDIPYPIDEFDRGVRQGLRQAIGVAYANAKQERRMISDEIPTPLP